MVTGSLSVASLQAATGNNAAITVLMHMGSVDLPCIALPSWSSVTLLYAGQGRLDQLYRAGNCTAFQKVGLR